MTAHTDRRHLQISTTELTVGDLLAFAEDAATVVDADHPVTVTHRTGLFGPPERIAVDLDTRDSRDVILTASQPAPIPVDDEHPDLDPEVPAVDSTRCDCTVTPVVDTDPLPLFVHLVDQLPATPDGNAYVSAQDGAVWILSDDKDGMPWHVFERSGDRNFFTHDDAKQAQLIRLRDPREAEGGDQ